MDRRFPSRRDCINHDLLCPRLLSLAQARTTHAKATSIISLLRQRSAPQFRRAFATPWRISHCAALLCHVFLSFSFLCSVVQYSISARTGAAIASPFSEYYQRKGAVPGPGQYFSNVLSRAGGPKYSIQGKPSDFHSARHPPPPGPDAYDTALALKSKFFSPSYSISKRPLRALPAAYVSSTDAAHLALKTPTLLLGALPGASPDAMRTLVAQARQQISATRRQNAAEVTRVMPASSATPAASGVQAVALSVFAS
jgi:hypothetical protein